MNIVRHFRQIRVTRFLEEIEQLGFFCVIKRLSGNDTGLTGGHQAGLYLPKRFFTEAIPTLCRIDIENPKISINDCYISSHDIALPKPLCATYYNNKYFVNRNGRMGTRNEYRITCWGGKENPLQNSENTGCLCVFAIILDTDNQYKSVSWLSESDDEDAVIEEWIGSEVDPQHVICKRGRERLLENELISDLPQEWLTAYPQGKDLMRYVKDELPVASHSGTLDDLLLARRDLEYRIFETIENHHHLEQVKNGFSSMSEFYTLAKSVENRRKSRSGSSLERHLEAIFIASKLQFETQVKTEGNKKPDFLFPSAEAYHDTNFPVESMTLLGSKTCCKDRWRQIITEADRFRNQPKYLFTLQKGISSTQLEEMKREQVILVVPHSHKKTFPESHRNEVKTLTPFIEMVRTQQLGE